MTFTELPEGARVSCMLHAKLASAARVCVEVLDVSRVGVLPTCLCGRVGCHGLVVDEGTPLRVVLAACVCLHPDGGRGAVGHFVNYILKYCTLHRGDVAALFAMVRMST